MNNSHITNLYAFSLGREWKLSLAELLSVFGSDSYREHTETIAILEIPEMSRDEIARALRKIGGSIRVIEILDETDERRFPTDVIDEIKNTSRENSGDAKKITFALGAYGIEYRTSDIGLRIKKTLVEDGMSVRLVNTENSNINAASFKKERLSKSHNEYNLINVGHTSYIGRTLACQDVDAYSHRDTAKSRDMIVGMMPPKLVQIILNLALSDEGKSQKSLKNEKSEAEKSFRKELMNPISDGEMNFSNNEVRSFGGISVYDPFCGLGTTLIEAANMGVTRLMGSDLSKDMARSTLSSFEAFVTEEKVWQDRIKLVGGKPDKDFSTLKYEVFELDATKIFRHFEGKKLENTVIVSEGYLGAIMERESITLDRVKSERMNLMRMYDAFFRGLGNLKFRGNIVMTFPFWDVHGTASYFTEIYEVLEDAGYRVIPLLTGDNANLLTPKGSLLYRRPGQNVGREVIKIQLRK